MKKNSVKIILGVAAGIVGLLITVGNGCSKRADLSGIQSSNSGGSNGDNTGSNTDDPDFIPGAKTASVVYAKQALDQLTACAGVVAPSDATMRMYESKKASISSYGDAISVTPPMMMAIANISGEICNDLINQEIAATTPRIFVGWNLNSTNLESGGVVTDAVRRLALSCWQGPEDAAELQDVQDLMATIASGAGASRRQALVMCTAMLSSLKSLLN